MAQYPVRLVSPTINEDLLSAPAGDSILSSRPDSPLYRIIEEQLDRTSSELDAVIEVRANLLS